jgi:hypothetical protein
MLMRTIKYVAITTLVAAFLGAPAVLGAPAAEAKKPAKAPKPYPLETCPVSGEKLGGMGEPVEFAYGDQEIQLCCKGCRKDFDANPAKFMPKIEAANKKVKPYKAETCLVSGEALGDKPRAIVFQAQEIKFCCRDCEKSFRKDTKKFLAKLPK